MIPLQAMRGSPPGPRWPSLFRARPPGPAPPRGARLGVPRALRPVVPTPHAAPAPEMRLLMTSWGIEELCRPAPDLRVLEGCAGVEYALDFMADKRQQAAAVTDSGLELVLQCHVTGYPPSNQMEDHVRSFEALLKVPWPHRPVFVNFQRRLTGHGTPVDARGRPPPVDVHCRAPAVTVGRTTTRKPRRSGPRW